MTVIKKNLTIGSLSVHAPNGWARDQGQDWDHGAARSREALHTDKHTKPLFTCIQCRLFLESCCHYVCIYKKPNSTTPSILVSNKKSEQ